MNTGLNGAARAREDESFPVYRPDELARMLGVTPNTLREWRKKGHGPKFIRHTSHCVVYLKTTVHQWLRNHEADKQTIAKWNHHKVTPLPPKPKRKRAKRKTRADQSPPISESPGA
jgi:transposase-like protein